ncbi:MAG: GNAT family N-acetyltransferase [Bacteroidetes bacterium]|nr:GNAT family N-acetyltransferase [Bacteroidota bacterium]
MDSPLDNPIWNALITKDKVKNIGSGNIAYMDAALAPFIGMPKWYKKNQEELLRNAPGDRKWFLLIAEKPQFVNGLETVLYLPLYQLTCTKLGEAPTCKKEVGLLPLDENHIDEMLALTQLTKPGPFTKRTIEFGGYVGIFENGKLVAMGGERLHVDGFTEISAICTHPDYQGLGYAAKITHHLASSVMDKGEIPFLHARTDNVKATALYKRLRFVFRSDIHFYILKQRGI